LAEFDKYADMADMADMADIVDIIVGTDPYLPLSLTISLNTAGSFTKVAYIRDWI